MFSAPVRSWAVVVLLLSGLASPAAYPQAVRFLHAAADPLPLTYMSSVRSSCGSDPSAADALPCDTAPMPISVAAVDPCHSAKPAPMGCEAPRDLALQELASMGKTGQKILRARDNVLEILQSDNACSEWIRQKDPDPAATFRTLSFAVDRHGEQSVHISKSPQSLLTYRDPYVASVEQGTGAFSIITLNAWGAFFQAAAPALELSREGGFPIVKPMRSVNIGPYFGNSLSAQTLTLLHEFGHVINLLPWDFENRDGKSVQNTAEVLRYCRAQIDSKAQHGTLQAMK